VNHSIISLPRSHVKFQDPGSISPDLISNLQDLQRDFHPTFKIVQAPSSPVQNEGHLALEVSHLDHQTRQQRWYFLRYSTIPKKVHGSSSDIPKDVHGTSRSKALNHEKVYGFPDPSCSVSKREIYHEKAGVGGATVLPSPLRMMSSVVKSGSLVKRPRLWSFT
jgi:hypothetical protein